MTGQDIYDKLSKTFSHVAGFLSMESGECCYHEGFTCVEHEEPGEVGWNIYCNTQDELRALGFKLEVCDAGNMDNDSVWEG